jgi:hypothetical protein
MPLIVRLGVTMELCAPRVASGVICAVAGVSGARRARVRLLAMVEIMEKSDRFCILMCPFT